MSTVRSILVASPIRMLLAIFILIVSASADDRGFKVVGWGVISDQVKTYPPVPDELGLTNVVAIAAGDSHALALRTDGTLVQWGFMWDGTNYVAAEPVPAGLKGVVGIAAGTSHSMALRSDGSVAVWARIAGAPTSVPPELSRVVAISGGDWHCLGLRSDGTIAVWGGDVYGSTAVPPDLSRVVSIASSRIHNLALKADGTVVSWGKILLKENDFANEVVPPGLTDVSAIALGADHSLALKTDGTVVAWGANRSGQINVPAELRNVLAIAANPAISLALKADGTVTDWGLDPVNYPVPAGLTRVVAIAAGGSFKLALVSNDNDNRPPVMFMHPFSQTALTGKALVLKADAVGEHFAYQWRKDGTNLPGANRSVYMINNVQGTNRGIYSVVASNPYGSVTSSNAVITVPIPGGLEFPTDTYNVPEGAGSIYIQVIRRGALDSAAAVQYSTRGQTATAGLDYTETSGEFHFAVNHGTNYFTVPILDDQIPEPDKTFTVTLTGEGLGERTTARVNIIDDGAPIQFAQSNFSVSPAVQQQVNLPIGRQGTGGAAATIGYATHAGSATPGVDYVETSGTLSFAAGEQFKTLPVSILNAHFPEAARAFTVTLSGRYVGTTNTARITILGGDLGFAFDQQNFGFTEGANSNATILVTRKGDLTTSGAVAYHTEAGSAIAGADYIETRGILQFAAGERTQTFDIPILDDTLIEGNESFAVVLSSADTNNSSAVPIRSTVTIFDDDRGLEFDRSNYYAAEGGAGATLTVVRAGTAALRESARILYATSGGTAIAGSDYVESSGELDFAPGESAKSFTVPILDDNEVEQTESFTVRLFPLVGAAGQITTATVQIQDNERGFEFGQDAYVTEGINTTATLIISRSGNNTAPATLRYTTHAGSAQPGLDYVETSATVEFATNENSKAISIPILDDNVIEGAESFSVTLSAESAGAQLGPRIVALVNLADDDRPIDFTQLSFYTSENSSNVMLTVARAGTSGDRARIIYATRAVNATPGVDYVETTGVLEFAAGERSKNVSVPILDDNEVDGAKVFTVILIPVEGTVGPNASATVTIQDDERPVFLDLSATNLARPDGPVQVLARLPDGSIFAGGAFTNVDGHPTPIVARLHSDGSLDDSFTSSLGTGGSVMDLARTDDNGMVIAGSFFRGGETQRRALAKLKADGTWEEEFMAGAGVSIDPQGNQPGSVTTVQVQSDGRIVIGGNFNYIGAVSRSGFARLNADGTLDTSFHPNWGPARKVRVQQDGRILASYGYGGSIVRFLPGGQTDSSFQPAIDQGSIYDFELQSDGRILIAGSFKTVNGVARPGLARLNADGSVDESFTATPSPVSNDMPYVWRVWLGEDGRVLANSSARGLFRTTSSGMLDVQFSGISDLQTVLSGTNGTILIGGGFSQLWPFPAPFLARVRSDGNGKGVTFGDSQQLPPREDSPFAEISLDRWGTLAETFTVRVRTVDSRATAGADYAALNQEITFEPGERQKTVRIPILDDGLLEGPEDFTVTLEQVTSGVALGPDISVVIQDNEVEPESDRTFQSPFINGGVAVAEATPDGHVYLSGGFQINGSNVQGLARLNPDGTLDPNFTFRSDDSTTMRAMAVQPDGQLIAATYNWNTGDALVFRIHRDGSLDTNFVQRLDCDALSVAAQPDGKLLVADGCGNLTVFNADGSTNRIVADLGYIHLLQPLSDGSILAGGDYSLTRLTATGEAAMTVSTDGPVTCITPLANGQFLVGGQFGVINDQPRAGIARLNPDGSVDLAFNAGTGANYSSVSGIAVGPDGRLLVGGSFTEWDGDPRNGLVRLKPDGTVDESDHTELPSGFRLGSLAPQATGVVVVALTGWGGEFGPLRATIQRIRYDSISVVDFASAHFAAGLSQTTAKISLERRGDTTQPATIQYRAAGPNFPEISGAVEFSPRERFQSIQLLIAGGPSEVPESTIDLDLTAVSGSTELGLKHADLTLIDDRISGAADQTFVPFLDFFHPDSSLYSLPLHGLAVQPNGQILLAGNYLPIDSSGTVASLIRLNPDGTVDSSFHTEAWAGFIALTADGKILAPGGSYGLERFLPNGSADPAFNPADQMPYAWAVLPLPDGRIIIGGQRRYVNNAAIQGIARLLENGSLDPDFHPPDINSPTALALAADGSLLVADLGRLLRLTPAGQIDPAFQSPVFDGSVQALAVQPDGRIVLGGDFSRVNDISRAGIARLQPSGELDSTFDPGLGFTSGGTNQTGTVNALLILPDGGILAGGSFSHVDGMPRWNLAKLDSAGTFAPAFGPAEGLYAANFSGNSVSSLAFTPEGDILAAGLFDHAGPLFNPVLVRLHGTAPSFELALPHLQTGEAELTIPPAASPVILEAATRLSPADWQPIATNNTAAPLIFREAAEARVSQRFYRATGQ